MNFLLRFCSLLLCEVCGDTGIKIKLSLSIDIHIFRLESTLLNEHSGLLLRELAKRLANVRVLNASQLRITHILDHDLIMLFTFFELLNFMMRHKVLFQINS